jgi:hypothetical protein
MIQLPFRRPAQTVPGLRLLKKSLLLPPVMQAIKKRPVLAARY